MKFSVFAIAALAAVRSSSCIVSATAAAASSRKRKIAKKVGATGQADVADGDIIPIGDTCVAAEDHCAIPSGLEHGFCHGTCQSGQPGAWCGQTSDCVVQNDLDPPHAVCRDTGSYYGTCQSGQPGSWCATTDDCAIPVSLDHGVCRYRDDEKKQRSTCQNGLPGALCGRTSDCVVQTNVDPPYAVCRSGKCQHIIPIGRYCVIAEDDCVIPNGLTHGVCRSDVKDQSTEPKTGTCQNGQSGSLCGVTDDCVVQNDLDPPHAVCRGPNPQKKCQRWVQCTIFIIIHTMW